jgi:hypothetical protein
MAATAEPMLQMLPAYLQVKSTPLCLLLTAAIAELRRKWFVESSRCNSEDMGTSGSGQLHLTQAWSVFMIVAAGAAVGLLAAAGEMLYYRRLYTREVYQAIRSFTTEPCVLSSLAHRQDVSCAELLAAVHT